MQLILLAAGYSSRFGGGLKQLAPVGPNGEAIMDYTARDAEACDFDGIVLIVREEIRSDIESHIRSHWSASLPVEFAVQGPMPGTAPAVLAAEQLIDDSFAVANADDLYGCDALRVLRSHFDASASTDHEHAGHALVAYQLEKTILTEEPVKRGICSFSSSNELQSIADHIVCQLGDGKFEAAPLDAADSDEERTILEGSALVSMNLWGFHHRMLDDLRRSIAGRFDSSDPDRELLLPDVVDELIQSGAEHFRVIPTDSQCVGITHRGDLTIVRDLILAGGT